MTTATTQNKIIKEYGDCFQITIGDSNISLTFSDKNKMNDTDKLEFATEFFKRCELSLQWELKDYFYETLKDVNPFYMSVRVNNLKKSIHSTSYFTMKNNEAAVCGQISMSGYKGSTHKIMKIRGRN